MDFWYDFGFVTCADKHAEGSLGGSYDRLLGGTWWQRERGPDGSASSGHNNGGSRGRPEEERPGCPFDEFWRAWEAGKLLDLFDKYLPPPGGGSEKLEVQSPIERFLSLPPSRIGILPDDESEQQGKHERWNPHPSVWRLKHLLALGDTKVRDILAGGGGSVLEVLGLVIAAADYGFTSDMDVRTLIALLAFYRRLLEKEDPMRVHEARLSCRLMALVEGRGRDIWGEGEGVIREALDGL